MLTFPAYFFLHSLFVSSLFNSSITSILASVFPAFMSLSFVHYSYQFYFSNFPFPTFLPIVGYKHWEVVMTLTSLFVPSFNCMASYGFYPALCSFLSSFLSGRSIASVVDGLCSTSCGVPQGSVLSPTLFLLYSSMIFT